MADASPSPLPPTPPPPDPRSLTAYIDPVTLQTLQDRFAGVTHVACSLRQPDGRLITQPTNESEFCRLMMTSPSGQAACRLSHETAAIAAGVARQACQTHCHAGLTQFAAPIMVEGRHVGTVLIGDRPQTPLTEDALRRLAGQHGIDLEHLRRAAWGLHTWSNHEMRPAADFLQFLSNALAARCYQEVQLRDRVDELSVLYRVSSMLEGTDDLTAVLNKCVALIAEVLQVKAASIRLLDEDTGELRIAAVHNLSAEYLNKGALNVNRSPIDAEALERGLVYVHDQPDDPRTVYPDEARREGIVSALVGAMRYRGKAIGVLRAYTGRPREFSDFEKSLIQAMGSQMAAAIMYARMRRDALEAERLQRQVELAADVQRRMIPAVPLGHAHLEFGAIYSPSLTLSGDFYDFLELPGSNLGVAIADVVGKGVPASLTMASVRASLRAHAKSIYDIDQIVSEVNRDLCRDLLLNEFVTAFYGVFSADGRRLTYCNAGHEPPILLRNGEPVLLEAGGTILGIFEDTEYAKAVVELRRGDVILMWTDGLVEGMNFDGQPFGRQRLMESLRQHAPLDAPHLTNQILWDLRRFRGLAPKSDDVTIVAVKVR